MRIASYWVVTWQQGGVWHSEVFTRKDLAQAFAGNIGIEDDVTSVDLDEVPWHEQEVI